MNNPNNIIHTREELEKEAEIILHVDLEACEDVIAIFDIDLNYIIANNATCKLLSKKKTELEGSNLIKLFPQLIASVSHRHLLSALSGKIIRDAISEGNITKDGASFLSDYYPLKDVNGVYAVVAITKKLYFP